MKCKDFEDVIYEIASRRAAQETNRLEALEHAASCLWCAIHLDEETRLTQSLQAFARTLGAQRAPDRVEERLVQAFRERASRTVAPTFVSAGRQLWRRLSWGLVIAATMAAASVVVLLGPRLHPGASAPPIQVANSAPHESSVDLEQATDFIPLRACDVPECYDEAMLVRVTLPADSLQLFGLPVASDYASDDSVEADVVLGSDGIPFAIRLVN